MDKSSEFIIKKKVLFAVLICWRGYESGAQVIEKKLNKAIK